MHLGELTGPVLLFGGPYSNLHALLALQAEAEKLQIPPQQIICTGDIVAYCGQPAETTDAVRQWGIHVLMGNCEESFATNADDCGCGFSEGTQCDVLSAQWFQFANSQLNDSHRHWFSQLPRTLTFTFAGKKCQVVHGSVTSINQFLFDSNADSKFIAQCSATDADIIIAGHSGIPFTKKINHRYWHNAGAIGMPANDGTQRTWFSTLNVTDNLQIMIKHHSLTYVAETAHQTMLNNGLANGYADALLTGLWPSMDVLPTVEREQQGKPLALSSIII